MIEHITPVPNAIPVVEGVVHARGRVVPALNLRVRFGFEKVSFDLRSRLLVVNVEGRVVGLLVDTAREFVRIPSLRSKLLRKGSRDSQGNIWRAWCL